MRSNRSIKISRFTRAHGSHFGNVFSRFIYHNIHGIIECDDTNHSFILIQNRNGKKIVFSEQLCDFFFISVRCDVYKGMFLVGQLRTFFADLQDPDYESAIAHKVFTFLRYYYKCRQDKIIYKYRSPPSSPRTTYTLKEVFPNASFFLFVSAKKFLPR